MTIGRGLQARASVWGLALLTIVMIGAEAPLFADRNARSTRSSESSRPQTMSRTSSPPASSSDGSSASATSNSSSGRSAVQTRQSTPASRGRSRGARSHRSHHLGLQFGYGYGYFGYGRYYGPGYYYPYYYHPYYWGVPYYVPRRARTEYELGALDLNVRPKKTEVYLDGQFVGNAGQYDGFPGHLWLEGGSYELIFYRPGFATQKRILTVYPGVVVDVRLQMVAGEAVSPDELSTVDRSGALAEVRAAYDRQDRRAAAAPRTAGAELDTRKEPGRVRLNVLPADASVYLDGRLLGSGDELTRLHAGLVIEAGSHFLEVVRPGYATERVEFAVEAGAEVELEVLLETG